MKRYLLFLSLISLYITLIYITSIFLDTDAKLIDFFSKSYQRDAVQDYIETKKKWDWLGYVTTPLIISIKILLVACCLNFIKLLDLPGLEKVRFSDFVFLALIAELVFVLAGIYKFVNFYWINTNYTLEDLQTYYPISLINLREHISMEKWLAYPLQLVNLFELFYWGILAYGIYELSGHKVKPVKSFALVAMTYGVGLVFWTGVVCFLILSVQY